MVDYVFGYGSLIESGSRLRTISSAHNAFPVKINGLRRGWWARSTSIGFSATYLGCIKADGGKFSEFSNYVTGVLFQVSEGDLLLLDEREVGYQRIRITAEQVDGYTKSVGENVNIWVYINEFASDENFAGSLPCKKFPIVQSYVDICMNGCLEIEEMFPIAKERNFASEFIKSTLYWSSYWVNDRIYPRRPFIMVPNANKIDTLLKHSLPEQSIFENIYFE